MQNLIKKIGIALILVVSMGTDAMAQVKYNSTGSKPSTISYRDQRGSGLKDKLVIGLDLSSLNPYFFNNTFQIGLRTTVGYKINDFITSGVSLSYLYYSQKNVYGLYDPNGNLVYKPFRYHNMAAGVWTRATLFQNFFLHAEYERNLLRRVGYQNVGPDIVKIEEKDWVNCLLVGGGFIQRISDRTFFTTTILYDLLQNTPANTRQPSSGIGPPVSISPYAGRIEYRIGINFGL